MIKRLAFSASRFFALCCSAGAASSPFPLGRGGLACPARQERASPFPLGRGGLRLSRSVGGGLPVPLGRGSGSGGEFAISLSPRLPYGSAILGASNPQNRGERFRKFFRGEFSEAFPSDLYRMLALRKGRAFADFARLTAPPQSKGSSLNSVGLRIAYL